MRSLISIVFLALSALSHAEVWIPSDPGAASGFEVNGNLELRNRALNLSWRFGRDPRLVLTSGWNGTPFKATAQLFTLVIRDGRKLHPSDFRYTTPPHVFSVASEGRLPKGFAVGAEYLDASSGLKAKWQAILRDGAHYVQTQIELTPTTQDVDLSEVALVDLAATAQVAGTVPGSPMVSGNTFFGVEHPMAVSKAENGRAWGSVVRKLPLKKGLTTTYSAVFGVAAEGQMRRSILRYVERERARAYKPFLHYNSWYDIGYFSKYTADQCIERINTYGEQLTKKRGVKMSSFLFDDGWDDTSTAWEFHSGFPKGFEPLKVAAAKYGAAPGIWLSPWGGYGPPHDQRVKTAKALGYEVGEEGYALSGPKYYERFHKVCLDLVGKYGINQFKLDGTGSPDILVPGSKFGSDFDAAIQLIEDLRAAKPGLFINLTTGTWPSPFWTRYADSIWRGGEDHSFAGVGSWRQKWITYRDGDVFEGIVKQGPYYPLNSLMLHGMIYAQNAQHLKDDPSGDFREEVRDYFGTGTQLQEMYVTPSLLTPANWDDLAESAKWNASNAETLVDTHWVGGDPRKLQVYGYASWSPKKGILVLRNPSDKVQSFDVDVTQVFELPSSVKGSFLASSPYQSDRGVEPIRMTPGRVQTLELKPFQVLVLEAKRG